MTRKLNIALVSDLLPDKKFTGGQVLERIIANTNDAFFETYWLNQSRLPAPDTLPDNVIVVRRFHFKRPGSPKKRGLSKCRRPLFSDPFYLLARLSRALLLTLGKYRVWRNRILSENIINKNWGFLKTFASSIRAAFLGLRLARELNTKKYDLVWIVLQGEKLAIIYYVLALLLNKKFILHQWDPIGWWLQNNNFGPGATRRMEKLVYAIERRAFATIVPSHAWHQAQLKRGLRSVRLDNFFKDDELASRCFIKLSHPQKLHAVFIGQIYASDELSDLVLCLAQQSHALGQKLVLHYFGSGRCALQSPNLEIVNHAYSERNALIDRIGKFDIALLPYPTQVKFRQASRYSFPSKSRIYLAAGLPILSLCELDSSPHLFYKNCFGPYYMNIREANDLQGFIERASSVVRDDIRARVILADAIIKENFSEHAELAKFHDILKEAIL